MSKVRRDSKGRALHKGETFRKDVNLYRYSYTDPQGRRRAFYAKDLPELREKEKQVEHDMLDGLDVYLQAVVDVNYVFDRYISIKRGIRDTSKNTYRYTYDKYVRNGFGKKRVKNVKYSDVVVFYNSLLDKGLSVSTVISINAVLRPAFQLAVRDSIIRSNPTEGIIGEIARANKDKINKRQALTYQQERRFLDYVESNNDFKRWAPLFFVMFGTGARLGEIAGLRWQDLDFENNTISINNNLVYSFKYRREGEKTGYHLNPPKSKSGIRTIPMLEKVKDAFIQEKTNQETNGYSCKRKVDGKSGFIFCTKRENPLHVQGVDRIIKSIVNRYNEEEVIKAEEEKREPIILPGFSCHIARHTFCTRLCENDTNIKVIQSVMGHSDIQTTMNIYASVTDQKKKETFEELNCFRVL